MEVRLTSTAAIETAIASTKAKGYGGFQIAMFRPALTKVIQQLYEMKTTAGHGGTYPAATAAGIVVRQSVSNGYPQNLVSGPINEIIGHMYATGYYAAVDENGFYIGRKQ